MENLPFPLWVNKDVIGKSLEFISKSDIEYALVKVADNLIFDFEVHHPLRIKVKFSTGSQITYGEIQRVRP